MKRGFTLTEMLIVIGIIASLLAIILPATMKAVSHGERMATQAMLASVATAANAYYDTWKAYPGPLDDSNVYAANAAPTLAGLTTPANVTGTENLVLGLYGGLQHDGTTSPQPINFATSRVGAGPYNMRPANRTRTNGAFMKDERLLSSGLIGTYDTEVPELTDRSGTPVLYYRARPGDLNQLVAGGVNGAGLPGSNVASPYIWNDEHFKLNDGIAYTKNGSHGLRRLGVSQHPSDGANPAGALDFIPFVNKNVSFSRGREGGLLIAAGPDGTYGTKDDVVLMLER